MLTEPIMERLSDLGLFGMYRAYEQTQGSPTHRELGFEERLTQLLDAETLYRQGQRLNQRLRWARLPQTASLEDTDHRAVRGLDKSLWNQLVSLRWMDDHLNVLLTGPTGIGKSYLACALAHQACRDDHSVRYFRMPRLIEELARARAAQKLSAYLKTIARVDLIVIDDFGLSPLPDEIKRDLLEILDDRYTKKSTMVTSQLPVNTWHVWLDEPTLADAILDRLVHNSHRLNLNGPSLRAQKSVIPIPETAPSS